MDLANATTSAAQGVCFLCGARPRDVAWHENGYDAVACSCGLVFVQPPPAAGVVDPADDAHSAGFYQLPAAAKVAWLRRHRANGRLLEVGCGDGWFLEAARRAGFDVHGIDTNGTRVAACRARGLDVRHGLFEDAAIAERFDVVFHCDLLSHFSEPAAALARMRELLRPDGLLFIEVGLLGGPARPWYPRIGGIGRPQHRWLYSEAALAQLFGRVGLRVVASRRFGLGPSVWLSQSIRRIAPSVRWLIRRSAGAPPSQGARPSAGTRAPTAEMRPAWRRRLDGLQAQLESFARYDIGAWTPHFGPATLFVLAEPAGPVA
jgi:SAM-dependent methyltransferase